MVRISPLPGGLGLQITYLVICNSHLQTFYLSFYFIKLLHWEQESCSLGF